MGVEEKYPPVSSFKHLNSFRLPIVQTLWRYLNSHEVFYKFIIEINTYLIRSLPDTRPYYYFHLRNIGAIRRYLNNETAAQIIHAFVTSKLDYCNSLLAKLPQNSLDRLKKVQNTAVRIITTCRIQDSITPHLKTLHLLPVHLRIDYKIILLTFKALHGLAPDYLRHLLKLRKTSHSLRSETKQLLDTPRMRTTSYGDRAFSVCAPVLWNVLPDEICLDSQHNTGFS